MPAEPALATSPSALTLEWDNAVLLNGVKVDIWAAACYGVGDEKTGTYHYHGNPGGAYDGTFRDDYEYVTGSGDLDRCNGMAVNGEYRYYITDNFPYMISCFGGTPDVSFNKFSQAGAKP